LKAWPLLLDSKVDEVLKKLKIYLLEIYFCNFIDSFYGWYKQCCGE